MAILSVLFVCTHNSARSILAEALLRHMAGGSIEARSAGSEPGEIRPLAISALQEASVPVDGLRSKGMDEFRLSRLWQVSIPAQFAFLCAGNEEVVRASSARNRWTWSPEKEGRYLIHVIAQDGEEKASAHAAFTIEKE